jgi:hypothetical protein
LGIYCDAFDSHSIVGVWKKLRVTKIETVGCLELKRFWIGSVKNNSSLESILPMSCCGVNLNLSPFFYLLMISLSLQSLMACKKVAVDLKSIGSIGGFSVDQSSVTTKMTNNPNFTVSGKCTKDLSAIEVSFDSGLSWHDLASVATAKNQCHDVGIFSATFNKDLTIFFNSEALHKYGGIYLRALGSLGNSDKKFVAVTEAPRGGSHFNLVSSEGYSATVSGYKIRAGLHAGHDKSFQNSPSGAVGYKVKNLQMEAVQ